MGGVRCVVQTTIVPADRDPNTSKSAARDPETVRHESALAPAIEQLPAEQREAIVQVVQAELSHSGPLPSPDQLSEYDAVLPGLAERIVRLTEREQEHRHETITLAVGRASRLRERGQALGMVSLVLMLAFCAYLVSVGSPQVAGAVAAGVIAAVVGIFVIGRRADLKERRQERSEEQD